MLMHHPAFEAIRSVFLNSLNLTVQEFRHTKTGAVHYHLATNNSENVFLVALRTMPMDSTGVAHILEHTALCGSEKYPVRDPFFLMIRRSLNTFMNAFTSSDWTAYPFASQNKKDFENLLSVYLDAVFFARLDPLDFAQEGIRVELSDPKNSNSPLVYKGVVFNEMKGAMSSPQSVLWEALNKHLFSTTTYHYNSGGEPEDIPNLSYQELVDFYKEHYHPSNAVFMTFGDMPVLELQTQFEEQALNRFLALPQQIRGKDEVRYASPKQVQETYALDEEDATNKTFINVAWLLGKTANLRERFEAELLSGILLENSASPLRQLLETTELGQSPSSLCGVDDSGRELTFMCGIEGATPENAEAFEQAVLSLLQKVVQEGVPQADVEAVLHQLELSQREIGGDSYPYGLQLILNGLGAVLHDGDPIHLWEIDSVLSDLRIAIQDPNYISSLIKKWLLDNTHRVCLTLIPDTHLSAQKIQQEEERLAKLKATLTAAQLTKIQEETEQLAARQAQVDDVSILPCVTRADIPSEFHIAEGETQSLLLGGNSVNYTHYAQGTNGLVYEQCIIDLPNLSEDEQVLLPLYTALVSELGAGSNDYLAMQKWQSEVSGGIRMALSLRCDIHSAEQAQGHLIFSGKALARNIQALNKLMHQTFDVLRFDEESRIQEMVALMKSRWESSITGQGHSLAMQAASAPFSAMANFNFNISGLPGIVRIKALDKSFADAGNVKNFAEKLSVLHEKIKKSPRQFLVIGEQEHLMNCQQSVLSTWQTSYLDKPSALYLPNRVVKKDVAWLTNTQVQFCSQAFQAVPVEHEDAAALMLLGSFLRNGFLHSAIREKGGAYGGGASYDSNACAFRFYSYRDPRFAETYADFSAAVNWLLTHKHDVSQLEESVLGVISEMDKPLSPSGEARQAFHNNLYGRTLAQRRRLRERLLATSIHDLQNMGEKYLIGPSVRVVVAPNGKESNAIDLGFYVEKV